MMTTSSVCKSMLFAGVVLMVAACGQKNAPDSDPVNTKAYYAANPDKAKVVVDKCSALDKNELSLLSPSKRKAWEETNAGINCANAQLAYGDYVLLEYQRKLIRSAEKYGKPAASASK